MNRHSVFVVALIVLSTAALAPEGNALAQGQVCGEIPSVLIVLDRSGSMTEQVNGLSKWSIAKSAVTTLSKQFSSQLALGMMLYPRWPETNACAKGKVNVAPKVSGGAALLTALNSAYPKGNTPIAASLDAAQAYFNKHKSQLPYVILVSDGKETCLLPKAPLSKPGNCTWDNGTNYRKCGGCGWQFCLKGGTWSSVCQARPEIFTCPSGKTCGSDALCTGAANGSLDAAQAAARLSMLGVKTHVIGFGSQVDAKSLGAIASAGGTGSYVKAGNLTQLVAAFQQIASGISCCGNAVLDAGEQCDPQIMPGQSGACPTSSACDDNDACTTDLLVGQDCDVHCENTSITSTDPGDGCCPRGATSLTDSDCPASCGNGVLDAGESCDPKIPAGQTGACKLSCDDGDPCTRDAPGGSACKPSCFSTKLSADPNAKDSCCPVGLSQLDDADCLPPCGPDIAVQCFDLCQGMNCADGEYCQYGQCLPWPETSETAGCDCQIGSSGSSAPWSAALGLTLLALLLIRRRG